MPKLTPEIMARIKENSRAANPNFPPPGHYDLLVSLVGHSPPTTAQAYLALEPRALHLICSEETEENIQAIKAEIESARPNVPAPDPSWETIDPTDPRSIYRAIKDILTALGQANPDGRLKVVIDVTGGKKAMSAAGALAAWQLDLDIFYGESPYDPAARGPIALERTVFMRLDNPMTLFREWEEARVDEMFNAGWFEAAAREYQKLGKRVIPEAAAPLVFKARLAGLYAAWCDADKTKLRQSLKELAAGGDPSEILSQNQLEVWRKQMKFLQDYVGPRPPALSPPLMYYCLGRHYFRIHRYDFAGQFFYRCLERIFRSRLELLFPRFKSDRADYKVIIERRNERRNPNLTAPDQIQQTVTGLRNEYRKIIQQHLPQSDQPQTLPFRLTFMNSAVLLTALGDALLTEGGFRPEDLRKLERYSHARNDSYLNHGEKHITRADGDKLRQAAADLLNAFGKLYPYTPAEAGAAAYGNSLAFIRFQHDLRTA